MWLAFLFIAVITVFGFVAIVLAIRHASRGVPLRGVSRRSEAPMSGSLRCSDCSTHWPANSRLFDPCPECGGKPWPSEADSILFVEAKSRKSHADFTRYVAKRDAAREESERRVVEKLEAIPTKEKAA